MNRVILMFEITDKQNIKRVDNCKVSENTINFLFANFKFPSEWEGLKKIALFKYGLEKPIEVELEENDTCKVALDVIKSSGFKVMIKGINENGELIIATTNEVFVNVSKNFGGENPIPTSVRQVFSDTLEVEKKDYNLILNIPNIYGTKLELDKETGILKLLGRENEELARVDFPTEKIITNAFYDEETKELVIDFENANQVRIPIDFSEEIKELREKIEAKKIIIDVEELPTEEINENAFYRITKSGGWVGTAVPNTGMVENVYFNTNLSVEEVIGLIESLTYDSAGASDANILLASDNPTMIIVILRTSKGYYAIMNMIDQTTYFDSNPQSSFVGWNPDITYPIVINSEVINETGGPAIGAENDKLTSLFSTTPFEKSAGKSQIYHIYKNKDYELQPKLDMSNQVGQETTYVDGDWVGTPLVNGEISNIYINNKLSIEEVDNILNNVNLAIDISTETYTTWNSNVWTNSNITSVEDITTSLKIEKKKATETGVVVYTLSLMSDIIYDSENGWKSDFNGIIEVNTSISLDSFTSLNNSTDTIVGLVSSSPRNKIEKVTLYKTKEDGSLDKDKPIQVGLTKEEVLKLVNDEFENAEEGAY